MEHWQYVQEVAQRRSCVVILFNQANLVLASYQVKVEGHLGYDILEKLH